MKPGYRSSLRRAIQSFPKAAIRLVVLSALLSLSAIVANAQSTSVTDGKTPTGLSPGAPAGSYALSGFENVNLFNGSLSFKLPLLSIGGRGSAGYTMMLPIEQKWIVKKGQTDPFGNTPLLPFANWWQGKKPGYGPGVMQGRRTGYGEYPGETYCGSVANVHEITLTRLTFTGSDGTEYELRDQLTNGTPLQVLGVPCEQTGASRGKVFVTADGSSATFISDEIILDHKELNILPVDRLFYPTGHLLLKDGTRYRIIDGEVSWLRDRNGNQISFGVDTITDSLHRTVTIVHIAGYDEIRYSGFDGTPKTIRVWSDSLGARLRPDFASPQTYHQLFPLNNAPSTNYNPGRVSKVELPDGRLYQFYYNPYGELARVVLPTGGAFEYDWAGGADPTDELIFRYVTKRRVYLAAGGMAEQETQYLRDSPGVVEVKTFNGVGTVLLGRSLHYFYGDAYMSLVEDPGRPSAISSSPWKEGREYKTEVFDIVNGTSVLKQTVENTWQQPVAGSTWPLGQFAQAETSADAKSNDLQITQTVTTLADTNQVTKQTFAYDRYSNRTDTYEFDYGSGAAPVYSLRHTHVDYLTTNIINGVTYNYDPVKPDTANPDVALTIHIRGLASGQKVYAVNPTNGVETLKAQSEIKYDEAALPLLTYGTVRGWNSPATPARGLPTTTRSWLDTSNTWLESHAQYDQCGNMRETWNPRDTLLTNGSKVTYLDAFSDGVSRDTYAFPTTVTTAVPDPNGVSGSNVALTTTSVYDFNTGNVKSTNDANGSLTSYDYTDSLDRLKQVTKPDTGRVRYNYFDALGDLYVQVLTDQDSSRSIETRQYFDGLGRATRGFLYEGTNSTPWRVTDTYYDSIGRASKVSNPYRVSSPGAAVPLTCSACTTNGYDALGRVRTVTTPDSAVVSTEYIGNTLTVTDQAGKQRRSVSDALGRLVRVDEPDNNGNLGLTTAPAQPTSYTYDVLGNLRRVDQGSQQRFFMYDSLSRLLRARNPELAVNANLPALTDPITGNGQWSTAYTYDNNGNLTQKTEARGVVSSYAYDALNRNTSIVYTNDPASTPAVYRYYDGWRDGEYKGIQNSKGRLWQTETTGAKASRTTSNNFDALGRPLSQSQQFDSFSPFTTQRTLNLAGVVTSQTYPSGNIVAYTYDAAGRTEGFNGNLGDAIQRNYSTEILYSPLGGMSKEKLGTNTPIFNKLLYNSRGQLAEMRASTSYTDPADTTSNRGKFINWYSLQCGGAVCNNSDNNGNLRKQETSVPNSDQNNSSTAWYQQYDYDSLNRLERVHEYTGSTSLDWQQSYSYDRWGNRTINIASGATFGSGINAIQTTIDSATNRLYAPNDPTHALIQYDVAGNQTKDSYSGNGERQYDAENRMIGAQDNMGGWTYYAYDGDGKRVRSWQSGVGTSSAQRWQVYGFDGELVAEYTAYPWARGLSLNLAGEYGYRNGQLLVKATVGTTLTPTGGGGFETPNVGNGNYVVNPSGSGWSFSGTTGISGKNSALTIGNPSAPEGNQVAFIQGGSSSIISQSIGGLTPGATYAVTFSAAQRGNCCGGGGEDFRVFFVEDTGSVPLGTFKPTTPDYQAYSTVVFSPQQGLGSLQFVGLNSSGGDNTALIDNVRIVIIDNVEWTVADQLGTPRMVFDKTGTLANVKRHDYLPFGEELMVNQGLRTNGRGYGSPDGVRQKFTSKERDNETGLDYFLARYYSSTQGRFTSPDEFKGGPEELFGEVDPHDPLFYSDTAEPQSLNKYQYCLNNPLRYIDPDGHQTTTADALKLGAGLTVAAPHPVAKAAGVLILVGVAVEVTIGWDNVGKAAKAILDHGGQSAMRQDMEDLRMLRQGNKPASSQQGQQGQSNTASPNPNDNDKKPYENTPENQERMRQGKPPIGNDGKPVELHHPGQKPNAPVREMTRTDHRGPGNMGKNHPNRGPSQIDRNQAAAQRRKHWKEKKKENQ